LFPSLQQAISSYLGQHSQVSVKARWIRNEIHWKSMSESVIQHMKYTGPCEYALTLPVWSLL